MSWILVVMSTFERQLAHVCKTRKAFLWIAIPIFVAALVLSVRSVIFVSVAVRTDAAVTNVECRESSSSTGGHTTYRPTFEFQDASGQQHKVQLGHSSSAYSYCVGEHVAILYDPKEPQRVRVASFQGTWGLTLMLLFLGMGCTCCGFLLSYVEKAPAKRHEERQGADSS